MDSLRLISSSDNLIIMEHITYQLQQFWILSGLLVGLKQYVCNQFVQRIIPLEVQSGISADRITDILRIRCNLILHIFPQIRFNFLLNNIIAFAGCQGFCADIIPVVFVVHFMLQNILGIFSNKVTVGKLFFDEIGV